MTSCSHEDTMESATLATIAYGVSAVQECRRLLILNLNPLSGTKEGKRTQRSVLNS